MAGKSKHHLNLEAFSEPLSREARYWVGFLLADGCVCNGRIGLGLKFEDAEHILKFARFVGVLEESVKKYARTNGSGTRWYAQLQFTGKELITQLAGYGVVPRKTCTATVPPSLAQDPDFWRGLVDGDGCVTTLKQGYSYNLVAFCGTLAMTKGFAEVCQAVTGFYPLPSIYKSIYQVKLAGSKATELLNWLYCPGAIALERKANAWIKA